MVASILTQEQLRRQIIRGLLTSKRVLSPAILRRKTEIAGLKLAGDYQIFSLRLVQEKASLAMFMTALRSHFGSKNNTIVLIEGVIFSITQQNGPRAMTIQSLEDFFDTQNVEVSLAASCVHHGAADFALAISEVRQAREVGEKIWPQKMRYLAGEMGMYIGLMPDTNPVFRRRTAQRLIAPLATDKVLLQTVETFLQTSLNVTDTARRLKVHRNTLLYRLEKVKRLTSFDVTKFEDALQIKLGLLVMLGDKVL